MTRTSSEDRDARKQGAGAGFKASSVSRFMQEAWVMHPERHAIARGHAIVFRDRHVADFTSLSASEVAALARHSQRRADDRACVRAVPRTPTVNLQPHPRPPVPSFDDLPWKTAAGAEARHPARYDRQISLTDVAKTIEFQWRSGRARAATTLSTPLREQYTGTITRLHLDRGVGTPLARMPSTTRLMTSEGWFRSEGRRDGHLSA